jgi:hypothetical protein
VTYTPNPNTNGPDQFKFKVSAGGLDSDPADVDITISAINDPPTLGPGYRCFNRDERPQKRRNVASEDLVLRRLLALHPIDVEDGFVELGAGGRRCRPGRQGELSGRCARAQRADADHSHPNAKSQR